MRLFSNVWSENTALLKDWWKSIPIHQNYTMALNIMGSCQNIILKYNITKQNKKYFQGQLKVCRGLLKLLMAWCRTSQRSSSRPLNRPIVLKRLNEMCTPYFEDTCIYFSCIFQLNKLLADIKHIPGLPDLPMFRQPVVQKVSRSHYISLFCLSILFINKLSIYIHLCTCTNMYWLMDFLLIHYLSIWLLIYLDNLCIKIGNNINNL